MLGYQNSIGIVVLFTFVSFSKKILRKTNNSNNSQNFQNYIDIISNCFVGSVITFKNSLS